MNRIVRHNYPVEKLPPDLREGLPSHGTVDVRIEVPADREKPRLSDLVGTGANVHGNLDEIVASIRRLRDED